MPLRFARRPTRAQYLTLWFAAVAAYSMFPVYPTTAVLETMGNDLANHVRHVYDCGLALREGQFPPLVAPEMNDRIRLPLFQYYSGTSYLIPGIPNAVGVQPYRALKISIFLHVLAGGGFLYAACRLLGAPHAAALVAGTAYQLFPFASADLYARGSYTQFASLHATPLVLYCALRVTRSRTRRDTLRRLCLCGLAGAYFIPLHPVQTVLCGGLAGVLATAHALTGRRPRAAALAKLAAAAALAVAAAAWFWVPVARDHDDIRIVAHGAFLDAGLADPAVLLWPTYREAATYPWAPQVGFHFVVAALAALAFWKQARAAGVVAALALLTIVAVVLFHPHVPIVQRVLLPLQWSHRLLVPAALAGTVCLALALGALLRRIDHPWTRGAASGAAVAFVLVVSVPYFLGTKEWDHTSRVRNVVSPKWQSPNSDVYALRGTNYVRLGIVRPDGALNVNADLPIHPEGFPTEVRVLLRRPPGASTEAPAVRVGHGANALQSRGAALSQDADHVRLIFRFTPGVGLTPGDTVVRFDAPSGSPAWPVADLSFRPAWDAADMLCRLPAGATRTQSGRTTEFTVDVPAEREGLYQFPVCNLPSNPVQVNGATVSFPPTANKYMVTVPLRPGPNVVKIRTRAGPLPLAISSVATAAMAAGLAATAWRRRERVAPAE